MNYPFSDSDKSTVFGFSKSSWWTSTRWIIIDLVDFLEPLIDMRFPECFYDFAIYPVDIQLRQTDPRSIYKM